MKSKFFLFQTNTQTKKSEDNSLSDIFDVFQVGKPLSDDVSFDSTDSAGTFLENRSQYGTTAGLYWVWKNTTFDYYGFSLTNYIPEISAEQLKEFYASGKDLLVVKPQPIAATIQENYRNIYYGYDFRMLMSILKKFYKPFYDYARDNYVDDHYFTMPCAIMKKDFFRKYCAWLFQLLEKCEQHLPAKYSKFQDAYLEHLSYYLLGLYLGYNKKSIKSYTVDKAVSLDISSVETISPAFIASLEVQAKKLFDERRIEELEKLLSTHKDDTSLEKYQDLIKRYSRERRYYKSTIIDGVSSLDEAFNTLSIPDTSERQKILIIEWNSISNDETLLAFDKLGFKYDSFQAGDIRKSTGEEFLDRINRHLDFCTYAFIFSLNYFPEVAEAAFTHETPYIAWTYDSPINIGARQYANYPTTHIFLFDSNECEQYKQAGFTNVDYVPLAVNVEKYDSIICTPEDIKKYEASISFVGSLYATKLNDAMKYLPDYQKGYLNALVDNILYTRNYDLLKSLETTELTKFLDNKKFNKIVNNEWDTIENKLEDTVSFGRLKTLLLKNVTNRERLILISMLSNHWDFKLYSYSTHDVFKSTIECGTVDYYTEMPKVFKCSKINMNMTLRNIQTGIPLRCLDIMGCHATLFSNHQKDFDEYFKDGESLILYDTFEEAYDKVDFYLKNDTIRERITDKGYQIVKEHFNYSVLMKKVIEMAGLGHLLKGK